MDFEYGWLKKSSFLTKEEHKSLSADQDQSPTSKELFYFPIIFVFCFVFSDLSITLVGPKVQISKVSK
jgi:hypothetical protein